MSFLTPNANGEAAVVGNFIRNQFAQARNTTHGLSDEQWHLRSTVSEFTPATLIDHIGEVADQYGVGIEASVGGSAEYTESLTTGETRSVEGFTGERLLADFDARVAAFDALLRRIESGEIPLDGLVPVPAAPWFPEGLTHWEVRWVLLHVATEVARHAGHGDIVREAIDGKGAYELNARADGEPWDDWAEADWSGAGAGEWA